MGPHFCERPHFSFRAVEVDHISVEEEIVSVKILKVEEEKIEQ